MEGGSPLSGVELYREQARQALDPAVWDYLEHGAGAGLSAAGAARAWQRLALRPRILRSVEDSKINTSALGASMAVPVMAAPTGRATRYAPEGESAVIEGVAAAGSITVLPSSAVLSLASLRALHPDATLWQQLYMLKDRQRMRARLQTVREACCRAVVLTVDLLPGGGWELAPLARASWEAERPTPDAATFMAAGVEDLAWLCAEAGLPVVVKGVLRADDAALCVEAGAAALIVSNHGGNQLDTVVSSADALPEVIAAVAGRGEVYVDGGIRDGISVLKALALGARAVLVGRPASYALAAGGAEAITAMLTGLGEELVRAMTLCGARTLADLDPSLVSAPQP